MLHRRRTLPFHPNGVQFPARDREGGTLRARTYYSVGGGFVVDESPPGADHIKPDDTPVPLPFGSAPELLFRANETGLPISGVMLTKELARRSESEVRVGLLRMWAVMQECVERGCSRTETTLPGRLRVPRRAPQLLRSLAEDSSDVDPLHIMDWVDLFALAVNAGTPSPRSRRSMRHGWRCVATTLTWSRSTRSSKRCARPVPT